MVSNETTSPGDVEMKEIDQKDNAAEKARRDADISTFEEIRENFKTIEKGVITKEQRYIWRILRTIPKVRKRLNARILRKIILIYYASPLLAEEKALMMSYIDKVEPMDTDTLSTPATKSKSTILPEIDAYIHLLIILYIMENGDHKWAATLARDLVNKVIAHNRRTLDLLASKSMFYLSRAVELSGELSDIRDLLHSRLRTCTLHGDAEGTAVLLNLLLRNYFQYNLYDQAHKLITRSNFPEQASNNELARHLFYVGRIRAIRLEYSLAHKNLSLAIRKAPQNTALGFRQAAHKFLVTVELLMGEIPEKSIFRNPHYSKALRPYFKIVQAVRNGDIKLFNQQLENYSEKFQKDGTFTLIIRLRHNVIKTGIRMICLSYSKIALSDVAEKLHLDSVADAESIISKCIRDRVISASINHEEAYMENKDRLDLYCTSEPLNAFHQRISFCLDIYSQSIKALRFPPKKYYDELETAEERREREQEEFDYATGIADDDDDFL